MFMKTHRHPGQLPARREPLQFTIFSDTPNKGFGCQWALRLRPALLNSGCPVAAKNTIDGTHKRTAGRFNLPSVPNRKVPFSGSKKDTSTCFSLLYKAPLQLVNMISASRNGSLKGRCLSRQNACSLQLTDPISKTPGACFLLRKKVLAQLARLGVKCRLMIACKVCTCR